MKLSKVAIAVSIAFVVGLAAASAIKAARAAPDGTLGMALMSAVVHYDSGNAKVVVDGEVGLTSIARISTGQYDLRFVRDVSDCTCVVSGGYGNNINDIAGVIATANCPVSSLTGRVAVHTSFPTNAADLPFQVLVFCPK